MKHFEHLTAAKAAHAAALERLADLQAAVQRLAACEDAVRSLRVELEEHDAEQSRLLRDWASAHHDTPAPSGASQRASIVRRLEEAVVVAGAATAARASLESDLTEARTAVDAALAQIDAAVLQQLEAGFTIALDELEAANSHRRKAAAQAFALADELARVARDRRATSLGADFGALLRLAERVNKRLRPHVEGAHPSRAEVLSAGSSWHETARLLREAPVFAEADLALTAPTQPEPAPKRTSGRLALLSRS